MAKKENVFYLPAVIKKIKDRKKKRKELIQNQFNPRPIKRIQ